MDLVYIIFWGSAFFAALYFVVKMAVRHGINESNLFDDPPPEFDPDEYLKKITAIGPRPPEPEEFTNEVINKDTK